MFYASQTPFERWHIVSAFVFELSKVDHEPIRERMVAGLRNVDEHLAQAVADGLGMAKLPDPLPAAAPVRDVAPSAALSILQNPPTSLAGRKVGVLVSDGADAELLAALRTACEAAGVDVELVAPTVGGVELSDGQHVAADHKVDGGPSVLFDAVALLVTADGAAMLSQLPAARDFVNDAYAHCKYLGHTEAALALIDAVGLIGKADPGFVLLDGRDSVNTFLQSCLHLRYWDREAGLAAPMLAS